MRAFLSVLVLGLSASLAPAHWIWIYPDATDGAKAHVVFSDQLAPDDNPKLLDRLTGAKLWVRAVAGDRAVEWTRGDKSYTFALPGSATAVGGVNEYGVVQRGEAKPFRLVQCPKFVVGGDDKPWAKLPIEIVPRRSDDRLTLSVYVQGKPAPAGLVLTVRSPDGAKVEPLKTDNKGTASFKPTATGLFGFSVPHTVAEAGEVDGKKFEEIRYSASLVFRVGDAPQAKGDPKAMELFEQARKARAHWVNFPGFTADVAVELGGQTGKGTLTVRADYKLTFSGLDKALEEAARKELTSVVGHRKDTSSVPTPAVVFDPSAGDSPLGVAIRVVGDKNDSGYRIRDRQLTVTQRTMPEQRFVILAQENVKNADGKYLPASHVVQYFDNATGKLVKTDANFHSWGRIGTLDLPVTAIKMTTLTEAPAGPIGPATLRLTLSNHKLLSPTAARR